MANIVRKLRCGQMEYRVQWENNEGCAKVRWFKTRGAAEKYSLQVEIELINEAVQNFNEAFASLSPKDAQQFLAKIRPRA